MDNFTLTSSFVRNFTVNNITANNSLQVMNSIALNTTDDVTSFNITDILGAQRDSLLIVIPMTIIYVIIFITGVIGNISTCIVIKKNRSMHTATNYYLFSLAISDFLLLLSGVPQEIYFIWSKYPYVFGETFCIGRGFIAETSANATVLTITAFTAERYVAICHPFLAHAMSKLSRATRIILLIWFASFLTAIPQAAQFGIINVSGITRCVVVRVIIKHSFQLSTFIFFFAPMSIILVLYLLIGLKLHQTSIMRSTNGNILYRAATTNNLRAQSHQGTKRVLKMLVAVVIAFFICWAPFHAQRLIAVYGAGDQQDQDTLIIVLYTVMTYVSGILYYLSTCINPLLYNIMSNKFREAFKETLEHWNFLSSKASEPKQKYNFLSRPKRMRVAFQESYDYTSSSQREESFQSTTSWKYNDSMTTGSQYRNITFSHGNITKDHQFNNCLSAAQSIQSTEVYNLDMDCSDTVVKIDEIDLPSKDASLNVLYTKQGNIQIRLLRKPHPRRQWILKRITSYIAGALKSRPSPTHMGFYTPPIHNSPSSMSCDIERRSTSSLQQFQTTRKLDSAVSFYPG